MTAYPPRLLSDDEAARYCGVSPETFRRKCPISPIQNHPFGRRALWDRIQLDEWVDALTGRGRSVDAPKPSDNF